jgi:hypothetical protein
LYWLRALELGADALGVLGRDRQVQGDAEVSGPERAAEVGEGGHDLLAGRVIRQERSWHGRLRCGRAVVLPGGGEEGLAGDLQACPAAHRLGWGTKPLSAGLRST